MASVGIAIDFVLEQEDNRLSGIITDDPRDSGGRTRFGVAQRFHPELTKSGYFDTMSVNEALGVAHLVYRDSYADTLKLANIRNQSIANAVLSFAINEGTVNSVKVLQEALKIAEDGVIGNKTLDMLNGLEPHNLMLQLYLAQKKYYSQIVVRNPDQQKFYAGWIVRVRKDCTVVDA